ncbi:ABC transporter ATP-binding protein, partial [Brucella abortus]|nr:ABC transporter ATP-binding protein [Brucella abortus]
FVQGDCRRAIPPLDRLGEDEGIAHRAACFHPRTGNVVAEVQA